jgi:hypothetical protein|tara:strand:+ start:273 stop:1850 length:1578 start_codon:yes stop_codon:yes gene_type:complete
MIKYKKLKFLSLYILIILSSFSINYYVSSSGVFPVDTFVHYDNGFRILLGELPVKNYFIVHGFLIDYIQAFFFKIFGNNWQSYVIHSSFFNVLISLFSFKVFNALDLKTYQSAILSILVGFLAYPISGTPFLDLHATYFSLFAIYLAVFSILKNKKIYWFWASFFLCIAFFSKQVPSAYTIVGLTVACAIFSVLDKNKGKNIFVLYILGAITFLTIFLFFLILQGISLKDFIIQLFLIPKSIGLNRYGNYELGLKNVIMDYKFIHAIFIPLIIINFIKIKKEKNYIYKKNFQIFLVIFVFAISTIVHQIYTKNQIYIFSLIPILAGFLIYFINKTKVKNKITLINLVLLISIITAIKYHERFNLERKFHELIYTNLSNGVSASKIDKKLSGLSWISPHFENPYEEIDNIKKFLKILKTDKENKIVISEYNFFSSILNQKLFSPSRTYDSISFPKKNEKFYEYYKSFFINNIKKNNIKNIYMLQSSKIKDDRIKLIVYNYIPSTCFNKKIIDDYILILKLTNCREL